MKISLAPADPNLAEWWLESRQEAETVKFNPLAPSTVEQLRERLSKSCSDLAIFDKAESFFWAINVDDEIVGHLTMQNINRMMLTAEIGYGVSTHARGRGIATLAIQTLAKNVFSQTPLRKLIAFVHEDNLPSRNALAKVGFKQEGLLREHYLVNGKVANEAIYGLLRSDLS
jgi:[ribosomal protein S5]-alanine N-acetyltransferase